LNSAIAPRTFELSKGKNSGGQMKILRALITGSVALVALCFINPGLFAQTRPGGETTIHQGSVVSFDYTLSDQDGKVLETSQGKQPMTYTHGKGEIIPGLEKELSGMKAGEEKKVQVKPEDGYGPINPQAFQEVPKEKLPPEALKVGTVLMAQGPQGQGIPVRVHEIKDTTVIMDFNHPMAGKTLSFDVKITEIKGE
jgi:FKBP-type peptidyl-prolyl cis-trans isomerase SlyD